MKTINEKEIIFNFLTRTLDHKYADLNAKAFIILYYVYIKKEVLSVRDYARILGTSRPHITRLTDKLVFRHLIDKSCDKRDKRTVAIRPIDEREKAIKCIFNI